MSNPATATTAVTAVIPPENVWTAADQDLFERRRDDEMDAGKSTDRAEAIAARAVNDLRRAEGRAPAEPEPDPRNIPDALDVATREELYDRAKELEIPGRSRMTKEELVAAIRTREAEVEEAKKAVEEEAIAAARAAAEKDEAAKAKKADAPARNAPAKNAPAKKVSAAKAPAAKAPAAKAPAKKASKAKAEAKSSAAPLTPSR